MLNLVPRLGAYVDVRSVIVPTECTACEDEGDVRVVLPPSAELPALAWPTCDRCGADMEPSVLLERYFAFLADAAVAR